MVKTSIRQNHPVVLSDYGTTQREKSLPHHQIQRQQSEIYCNTSKSGGLTDFFKEKIVKKSAIRVGHSPTPTNTTSKQLINRLCPGSNVPKNLPRRNKIPENLSQIFGDFIP
ncbi:MAG: hypothetical protein SFX18_06770 [Pirellulales bacterium]|nr:hypothetical protein [Pirellulales bacterium]